MLLRALLDYANQNKELPDFYDRQEVRYALHLNEAGDLVAFDTLTDEANPKRGVVLPIPYVKRTVGVVPLPMDRGDYVLGIPVVKKTSEEQVKADVRTPLVHRAYIGLLADAISATGLASLRAAHSFASKVDPATLRLPAGFDASRFIAIYVDGVLLTDDPAVRTWWAGRQIGPVPDCSGDSIPCGVCGLPAPPVESVPVAVRGLGRIGGQATMALVSGNMEVFERHGLARASGASLCLKCGNATHQALNQLIGDRRHAKVLGDSIFVWWSTEETEDLIAALSRGDDDEAIGRILDSLMTGQLQPRSDLSRFYGVALGANSSRVVVRSWIDTTLVEAQGAVARWFDRTRVVDRDGVTFPRLGLWRLLASLAPPGAGDPVARVDPALPNDLLVAGLTGAALPVAVLHQTLRRIRAEQGELSCARVALLKACITPIDHDHPEEYMTGLDPTSTDPAYRCGRLLALLDDAARLATSANNSLVDRNYSGASTMPQITLTRLLRLHRAHLNKLRRDRPGAAVRIEVAVIEIMAGMSDLPRTLSVSEQARFALGLYHQQAAGRAAMAQARESKTLHVHTTTEVEEDQ